MGPDTRKATWSLAERKQSSAGSADAQPAVLLLLAESAELAELAVELVDSVSTYGGFRATKKVGVHN